MRFSALLPTLFCAVRLSAQAPVSNEDPGVLRARLELNKIAALVDSGVLPRARLDEAKDAFADAQDDAAIRASLYRQDITVEQADAVVESTAKRTERRQNAFDERSKLAAGGIIARNELEPYQAALDQAKTQHNWAVTRAALARELVELARSEQDIMRQLASHGGSAPGLIEHFIGSNRFAMADFAQIERAFELHFNHTLPVSAMGETEVHRSLGFDHRNRVDVALVPDQPEGQWLRKYLAAHGIPFFAFRSAVSHQATGAHIHIGPPSQHYMAQTSVKPHPVVGED